MEMGDFFFPTHFTKSRDEKLYFPIKTIYDLYSRYRIPSNCIAAGKFNLEVLGGIIRKAVLLERPEQSFKVVEKSGLIFSIA